MTKSNDKKIVIYSHSAGSPDIGPNIRVYNIAKALIEEGYDVTLIASGFFHKYNKSQVSGLVNEKIFMESTIYILGILHIRINYFIY